MFHQTQLRASAIAQTVDKNKYGFPVTILVSILAALLPELIKCFAPKDAKQVQEYAESRYNAKDSGNKYGGYRPATVKRVMRLARIEGVKEGQEIDDDLARELAIKTLEDARTAPTVTTQLIVGETYQGMKNN